MKTVTIEHVDGQFFALAKTQSCAFRDGPVFRTLLEAHVAHPDVPFGNSVRLWAADNPSDTIVALETATACANAH